MDTVSSVRKWVEMVLLDRVFKKPHPSRQWLKTANFTDQGRLLTEFDGRSTGGLVGQ